MLIFGLFLSGLIDPATESEVFSHIASHGFIVVSPHKLLTLPTSQYDATWLVKIDEWCQTNLVQELKEIGKFKKNEFVEHPCLIWQNVFNFVLMYGKNF